MINMRTIADARPPARLRRGLLAAGATAGLLLLAVTWAWPPFVFVLGACLIVGLAVLGFRDPPLAVVTVVVAALGDPYILRAVLPPADHYLLVASTETILVATAVGVGVRALREQTFVPAFRDPVLAGGVAFAAVGAISAIVNGVPPLVAALGIGVTLDTLAVYVLVRMAGFGERMAAIGIATLAAAVALAGLIGIAQVLLTPDILGFRAFSGRFGEGARATGFLGNPNMLGAVIAMVLPFPVYAVRHLPRRNHRIAAGVVMAILVLALVDTYSRGAWLAAFIGVPLAALFVDRRAVLVFLGTAVVAFTAAFLLPTNLLNGRPTPGGSVIVDSTVDRFDDMSTSNDVRLRFLVEGIPIAADHPLLGVGPGRYGGAIATIIRSPVYAAYDTDLYGYRSVHDFWLHTVGEVGALGTAAFLSMIVALGLRFRARARASSGVRFVILAGAVTAVLVLTINNLTEMIFEGNLPSVQAWALLGIASVLAPAVPLLASRSEASATANSRSAAPD